MLNHNTHASLVVACCQPYNVEATVQALNVHGNLILEAFSALNHLTQCIDQLNGGQAALRQLDG